MAVPKGTGRDAKSVYVDRSIVYKDTETATVQNVVVDRNEDSMRFAKVGLRKVRPVAVGDKFCLKPTAEVLTEDGWVPLSVLDINVPVATMDPDTLKLSYVKPITKHVFDYDYRQDGSMYRFQSGKYLTVTTAEHKNYVSINCTGKYEMRTASDCIGHELQFKHTCVNPNTKEKDEALTMLQNMYSGKLDGQYYIVVRTIEEASDVQILCFKAGLVGIIKTLHEKTVSKLVVICRTEYEEFSQLSHIVQLEEHVGQVMCIEVPNTHLFYYRENALSPPMWTGNSSRSGQKGICAMLLREEDMPVNMEGIHPDIIFNPHGLPSRMTCAQLIESLIANVCAIKGTHFDGTIFKKVDIESYAEILEKYGMNRYGYDRMISGVTGEYVDTLIFFGPTYYQRLQKFVSDAEYSVRHALTDALTLQPLDGQSSGGGLRIGEMERDVLSSHGSSRFMREKFFNHSDGYTEYICRCGKPAIVNHQERVYKCKHCKDNADITAIPSSWSSKLAMQEIQSCNIAIRRIPRPFTFESNDTEDKSKTRIEEYDAETLRKINTLVDDLIDDSATAVDAD